MRLVIAKSARILGLALVLVALATPAAADRRVALVIGNSAYVNAPPLRNPRNDATAIAAALRRVGFEVLLKTDVPQAGMAEPIGEFVEMLRGADAAVFFYAGHALAYEGRNYIVPVDARAKSHIDVKFQMSPLDHVIEEMAARARVNIVLLDACRDNPIADQIVRSLQGDTRSTSSVSRGLAAMETPGRSEMLIAYATRPGAVAEDGTDDHSPFTRALLEQIESDGATIEEMLMSVRGRVLERTANRQAPEYLNRLNRPFSFRPGAAAPLPAGPRPDDSSPGERSKEETLYWESVRDLGDADLIQGYLDKYPSGKFASVARALLVKLRAGPAGGTPPPAAAPRPGPDADAEYEALLRNLDDQAVDNFMKQHPGDPRGAPLKRSLADKRAWSAAETANSESSYERYLLGFPTGTYAGAARERMARLAQERWALQNPPRREEPAPAPAPAPAPTYEPPRPRPEAYAPPPAVEYDGGGSPSFNCRTNRGVAEQAICGSSLLSRLDVEMAERYQSLKGRLASSVAVQLRDSQRAWLKSRDSCGSSSGCIERLYRQRIQQLIEWGG